MSPQRSAEYRHPIQETLPPPSPTPINKKVHLRSPVFSCSKLSRVEFIVLYFQNSVHKAERQPREWGKGSLWSGGDFGFLGLYDDGDTLVGKPVCVEEGSLEI